MKVSPARRFYYSLSPRLRFLCRRLYYLPLDTFQTLFSLRNPLEPPRGLNYTGAGDFIEQGRAQLAYLQKYTPLRPSFRILDIGCGMGRTAVALSGYLSDKGSYEGFDVVSQGIKWCRKKIGRRFSHFNFTFIDLRNDLYKTSGADAVAFQFPYRNEEFDQVILFSVFTHMLPPEIAHYLGEIWRVLRPGSTCLASFFLYHGNLAEQSGENPVFNFPVQGRGYRLMSRKVASANVAISISLLEDLSAGAGLEIIRMIPGYWRMPGAGDDFQDLVVFRKL